MRQRKLAGETTSNWHEPGKDDRLLEAVNDGYRRLRTDEANWTAFEAEVALWDITCGDGVDDSAG